MLVATNNLLLSTSPKHRKVPIIILFPVIKRSKFQAQMNFNSNRKESLNKFLCKTINKFS